MDLRTVESLLRRVAAPGLRPPRPDGVDAWLPEARATVDRLVTEADAALAEARETAAAALDDDAPWRALEEACRRVEQELIKPSTLRSRLDQGRRSLAPKVEARLAAMTAPVVERDGGRLIGRLDADALARAESEADGWSHAWAGFVYQQLDADLAQAVAMAWRPRRVDLPVPAPGFAALHIRAPSTALDLPEVRVERPRIGWGAGFRHARSLLYGVLSAGLILGIGRDAVTGVLMVPVGLAAVAFGYVQAMGERAAAEERLADEVRRRADTALAGALRTWIERQADKILDDAQGQLHARRRAFVDWYRRVARPAIEARERTQAARRAEADAARRELTKLEARSRDLRALKAALATTPAG